MRASNGVIHVIDCVLFPPAPQQLPTTRTVAQVIVDRFELSIFEQALTGGGLLAAINQVAPVTCPRAHTVPAHNSSIEPGGHMAVCAHTFTLEPSTWQFAHRVTAHNFHHRARYHPILVSMVKSRIKIPDQVVIGGSGVRRVAHASRGGGARCSIWSFITKLKFPF